MVGTGDFNGDGKSDIVWRDTTGNTSIWLMNGATVSSAVGVGNVPTTWSIVLTGDYNGDGMSDLLWRDTSGNTAMWFMNGDDRLLDRSHRQHTDNMDSAVGQRRVKATKLVGVRLGSKAAAPVA